MYSKQELEIYHQGYKQGRFDEYAERTEQERTENVKTKTDKQKNCPYCHDGYFEGESGWQNANVFFSINNDGTLETLVDGVYGYVQGLVECPFCKRPLNEEDNEDEG